MHLNPINTFRLRPLGSGVTLHILGLSKNIIYSPIVVQYNSWLLCKLRGTQYTHFLTLGPEEGGRTRALWERIYRTTKQNSFVFLANNFISTNKKGKTKLCCLTIGWNKIVHHENKNILAEIHISLFSYFAGEVGKE